MGTNVHIAKCKKTHNLLKHMFKSEYVTTNNIKYNSAMQSHAQDKLEAANKAKSISGQLRGKISNTLIVKKHCKGCNK
jgi:hypothetical protein